MSTWNQLRSVTEDALGLLPFGALDLLARGLDPASPLIRADVTQTKDAVVIECEVPGVPLSAIEIECKDGLLSITANKPSSAWAGNLEITPVRTERLTGTFKRQWTVGESLDTDGISASLKDGVLTVTIPVKAAPKAAAKKIQIASG